MLLDKIILFLIVVGAIVLHYLHIMDLGSSIIPGLMIITFYLYIRDSITSRLEKYEPFKNGLLIPKKHQFYNVKIYENGAYIETISKKKFTFDIIRIDQELFSIYLRDDRPRVKYDLNADVIQSWFMKVTSDEVENKIALVDVDNTENPDTLEFNFREGVINSAVLNLSTSKGKQEWHFFNGTN